MKTKLLFNSRDELVAIDFDHVAVVQADGNYSRVVFINKHEVSLAIGINKLSEMLRKAKFENAFFVKIGRSLLVNQAFLERIDLQKQQITLTDKGSSVIRISVTKNVLKAYKNFVSDNFRI